MRRVRPAKRRNRHTNNENHGGIRLTIKETAPGHRHRTLGTRLRTLATFYRDLGRHDRHLR
jgi:hypothetical protein